MLFLITKKTLIYLQTYLQFQALLIIARAYVSKTLLSPSSPFIENELESEKSCHRKLGLMRNRFFQTFRNQCNEENCISVKYHAIDDQALVLLQRAFSVDFH